MDISMRGRYCAAVCLIQLLSVLLTGKGVEAQDMGSRWSEPVDITQPSTSTLGTFGLLLCDQYQDVHLFWADLSEEGAAIFYRNDVVGDWSTPVDVLVMPFPVIAELHGTVSSKDDTLHLIWLDNHFSAGLHYSRASLIAAGEPRAWADPVTFATGVWNAAIMVDSAGVIHIVYGVAEDLGTSPEVYHIGSDDGGNSWSAPVSIYSPVFDLPCYAWVLMAIDDADRIHLGITMRSQEYGLYSEVGYMRSEDGGRTWSEYQPVDQMGTTFQGVNIMAPYAFGENEIHLTWHDPRRMHRWSLDGGHTWYGPVAIMSLGAAFGGPNMLVKDSAGTVHVLTAVGDGVYSASWDGARWGGAERIDDREIDPHGQNMALCQGNRLHVVYYDRIGDNRVWYSTRQVDAVHIERQPLPNPPLEPTSTATPQASIGGELTGAPSTITATPVMSWSTTPPEPAARPWLSMFGAAVPVVLLVGGVAIVRWRRSRR